MSSGGYETVRSRVLGSLGALALGIAVLAAVLNSRSYDPAGAILVQVAGLAFVLAGLLLARSLPGRRDPELLVATGILWLIGDLATQTDFPVLRGLAELTFDLPELTIAWLVLGLPGGKVIRRSDRVLLLAIAVVTCVLAPLQTALLPPPNDPVSLQVPWLASTINVTVGVLGSVLGLLAAYVLGLRYRRGSAFARRVLGPVLLATAVIAGALVAQSIINATDADASAEGLVLPPRTTGQLIAAISVVAWAALALAFFVAIGRSSSSASAVGRLLPQLSGLSERSSLEELRAVLARAVGDPSLVLELEPDGPAGASQGRASTDVVFGTHTLARLHHDAALTERPAALDAATAALALLLGRQRLSESLAEVAERSGEDRERLESELSRVRDAFGAFADPAVASSVVAGGWELGGHEVEASVFFLDVRGFTAWSERATPTQVMARVNALWELAVPLVVEHGGHANKFMGDGMLAVFGAPSPCPDHASAALAAALRIVDAVQERFHGDVVVGIGLHSGLVMAGNVGGGGRVEFAVMGDVVNTASRIEAFTKVTGDAILLSQATYGLLGEPSGFITRPGVSLPGKQETIALHTPIVSERQPSWSER